MSACPPAAFRRRRKKIRPEKNHPCLLLLFLRREGGGRKEGRNFDRNSKVEFNGTIFRPIVNYVINS